MVVKSEEDKLMRLERRRVRNDLIETFKIMNTIVLVLVVSCEAEL